MLLKYKAKTVRTAEEVSGKKRQEGVGVGISRCELGGEKCLRIEGIVRHAERMEGSWKERNLKSSLLRTGFLQLQIHFLSCLFSHYQNLESSSLYLQLNVSLCFIKKESISLYHVTVVCVCILLCQFIFIYLLFDISIQLKVTFGAGANTSWHWLILKHILLLLGSQLFSGFSLCLNWFCIVSASDMW